MVVYVNWEERLVLTENGALNWLETRAAELGNDEMTVNDYLEGEDITAAEVWFMSDERKAEVQTAMDQSMFELAKEDFDYDFERVEPSDY